MKILILSVLTFILGLIGFLNPIRDGFLYFFSPLQLGIRETIFNAKSGFLFFTNLAEIRNENLKLLEEKEWLYSEIVRLKAASDENEILKNQLELKNQGSISDSLVMANVLGNPKDVTGVTFFLDKGSANGIKVGDNVILRNYLVGIVREVSATRSLVDLIISPGVSITAYDLDSSEKVEGLVQGRHGTSIEMIRILPEEKVSVGDTILSSGKDGVYAAGLIIGEITQINEDETQPLKSANLKTILDFSNLKKVFVLIS